MRTVKPFSEISYPTDNLIQKQNELISKYSDRDKDSVILSTFIIEAVKIINLFNKEKNDYEWSSVCQKFYENEVFCKGKGSTETICNLTDTMVMAKNGNYFVMPGTKKRQ